ESLKGIFSSSQMVQQIKPEQLETYRTQLMQRAELIMDGLIGVGLKTRLLGGDELTSLYYGLYNPGEKVTTAPPEKLPT
ncbi:MAG: hypothetical protein AAB638_04310, partial [Patescibacteria group bacterium]